MVYTENKISHTSLREYFSLFDLQRDQELPFVLVHPNGVRMPEIMTVRQALKLNESYADAGRESFYTLDMDALAPGAMLDTRDVSGLGRTYKRTASGDWLPEHYTD